MDQPLQPLSVASNSRSKVESDSTVAGPVTAKDQTDCVRESMMDKLVWAWARLKHSSHQNSEQSLSALLQYLAADSKGLKSIFKHFMWKTFEAEQRATKQVGN